MENFDHSSGIHIINDHEYSILTEEELNELKKALRNPASNEIRVKIHNIIDNLPSKDIEEDNISDDMELLSIRSNFIDVKNKYEGYYYKKSDDGYDIVRYLRLTMIKKKDNIIIIKFCVSSEYGLSPIYYEDVIGNDSDIDSRIKERFGIRIWTD